MSTYTDVSVLFVYIFLFGYLDVMCVCYTDCDIVYNILVLDSGVTLRVCVPPVPILDLSKGW